MATIQVCDICGEDAVGVKEIDVCSEHGDTPARKAGKKVRCDICGKRFTAGPGIAAHLRSHGK